MMVRHFPTSGAIALTCENSAPPEDCFDFTQKPRKFVPIKAPHGIGFFEHQQGE
ncbi:MAG TPA: hypothetical protein VKR56_11985 [Candidatus Cybelea sp.]|jgi:hypothetical protein|nr:hypothetical protein [Candidatus Cybelea sp.]